MLAHGLVPGNSDGLEIQFFPQPITEKVKADMLENDAKEFFEKKQLCRFRPLYR